jgi:hypothetical protein
MPIAPTPNSSLASLVDKSNTIVLILFLFLFLFLSSNESGKNIARYSVGEAGGKVVFLFYIKSSKCV